MNEIPKQVSTAAIKKGATKSWITQLVDLQALFLLRSVFLFLHR